MEVQKKLGYFIGFIAVIVIIALIKNIADSKTLVDCKACGKKMSKAAKTCPHCGAKPTSQIIGEALSGVGCAIFLVPIIIAIVVIYIAAGSVLK